MRFRAYQLVSRAVEEGAARGVRLAYKHTDYPTHDAIVESVEREVMNALDEILDFDTATKETA